MALAPAAGWYISALRAAGNHVAVALAGAEAPYEGPRVVVIDVAQRQVEHETRFPAPTRLEDFEVSRDGSLAVLTDRTGRRCDGHMTTYSPNGQPGTSTEQVCELLAALPTGPVLLTGQNGTRTISQTSATSTEPRPIVQLGKRQLSGADADGNRLVWSTPSCSGANAIHLTRLNTTVSLPPRGRCRKR